MTASTKADLKRHARRRLPCGHRHSERDASAVLHHGLRTALWAIAPAELAHAGVHDNGEGEIVVASVGARRRTIIRKVDCLITEFLLLSGITAMKRLGLLSTAAQFHSWTRRSVLLRDVGGKKNFRKKKKKKKKSPRDLAY